MSPQPLNFQGPFGPQGSEANMGLQPMDANYPAPAPAAPAPLAHSTTQTPIQVLVKQKTMQHFSTKHRGMIIIYFSKVKLKIIFA